MPSVLRYSERPQRSSWLSSRRKVQHIFSVTFNRDASKPCSIWQHYRPADRVGERFCVPSEPNCLPHRRDRRDALSPRRAGPHRRDLRLCRAPPQARREKPRVSAFTSANIDKILRSDLVQPARARGPRSVLWMWCTGAPWSVRQELARVWCDHLPAAPLRNPEGGSLCYSRSAAIAMISIFSACAFCRSFTAPKAACGTRIRERA